MEHLVARLRVALTGETDEVAVTLSRVVDLIASGNADDISAICVEVQLALDDIEHGGTMPAKQSVAADIVPIIDLDDNDDDDTEAAAKATVARDIDDDDDLLVVGGVGPLNLDDDDDEYEEAAPVGVDLSMLIESLDHTDAVVERVLAQLASGGVWQAGDPVESGDDVVVALTAIDGAGAMLLELPPATVIFENTVPVGGSDIPVKVVIAGPEDPDRPPIDVEDAVRDMIDEMTGALGAAAEDIRVGRIVAKFTACESDELSVGDLDGDRGPMAMFLQNLTPRTGPLFELSRRPDVGDPASVDVVFEPVDNANAMLLGAALGVVGYGGELPFRGLGRIRASIVAVTPAGALDEE